MVGNYSPESNESKPLNPIVKWVLSAIGLVGLAAYTLFDYLT